MSKESSSVMMTLRLPLDVKRWLARQAKINFTSQNEQVIRTLRDKMDA